MWSDPFPSRYESGRSCPFLDADLGLGQIDPIGGFVGCALKAGDNYKSLSLAQSVAIELLPILAKILQN